MKKYEIELIIIVFLWLNIIYSIIFCFDFPILFIAGILSLMVVTLLYFKNLKISKTVLFIVLTLGLISVLNFNVAFDFNLMGLINIPILIFLSIFIYRRFNFFEEEYFSKSAESYNKQSESNLNFFIKKFENLSKEELEEKIENKDLTIEARKAAEIILKTKINN